MKVAILIPSGEDWKADFGCALAGLFGTFIENVELRIINSKSSLVTLNRNSLVREGLKWGADYVLFLDSDMIFPPETLLRLLSNQKDIVGATAKKRKPPYDTVGEVLNEADQYKEMRLVEMSRIGACCLLIKTSVFDSFPQPWFRELYFDGEEQQHGEDYYFCDAARQKGYQIWCDVGLTLSIGHIGDRVVTMNTLSEKTDKPLPWMLGAAQSNYVN